MRAPLSWLQDYVGQLPSAHAVAAALTDAGLKVERIETAGEDIDGVVVARVRELEELAGFKKPIRWVTLDDGSDVRQVICGATNFAVGDLVAYARPPATLPGGFRIEARKAYGHVSDGMICSGRELAISDEHAGILVLPEGLELGSDVADALGLREAVLDIAVNPDRGYALSIRGVAREAATALGLPFTDPAAVAAPAATESGWPVRLDDASGCDRYVARVVRGVDPAAPSPAWLQRRVTQGGMRPVSMAVDVTNYVMLLTGQPLHAFDAAQLAGPIVVRRARAGERLTTLDHVTRELSPDDVLIADDTGPIALAGVMGGGPTEVSAATTDLLVEAAHFDAVAVAYTARRHRLPSEASRRFERGVDPALAASAAELAVRLLVELGGGVADPGGTDVDHRAGRPAIRFDPLLPGRLAGTGYPEDVVRRRLADVGCDVTGDAGGTWQVLPPSWRPDLRLPVDLVEEVARLEGYARIPSMLPTPRGGRGLTRAQRLRRQAGRALAGAGWDEVLTYPFVAAAEGPSLLLEPGDPRNPTVRLANPVSDEAPYLRATLLPGLLATAARNASRGFADIGIFESGLVFRDRPDRVAPSRPPVDRRPTPDELAGLEAALPEQPRLVAAVGIGHWERPGWWGPGRPVAWGDAVEAAHAVAGALGLRLDVVATATPPWHPGRCAALLLGDAVVGHAGELHPRVVESYGLPARACAMELDLDRLVAAAPEAPPAPLVSPYPVAALDVALVVDAATPAAQVESALRDGAGPLLESLHLFDVYSGPQVGEGNRSLAYALRFRAPDRTLTDEETLAARDAAVAEAATRVGARLRGN